MNWVNEQAQDNIVILGSMFRFVEATESVLSFVYCLALRSRLGGVSSLGADSNDIWLLNVTSLVSTKLSTSPPPAIAEGHGASVWGEVLVVYGGYSCTQNHSTATGGAECFQNSVRLLPLRPGAPGYLNWTVLNPSTPNTGVWPPPRAFHAHAMHDGRVFIFGGAFLDRTLVFYFRNDLAVFDIASRAWMEVTARGVSPSPRWSMPFSVIDRQETDGSGGMYRVCCRLRCWLSSSWLLRLSSRTMDLWRMCW